MKSILAWLACSVALGQAGVRLKVIDELGQPVAGAFAVGGSIHPGVRESDAKGELPYRASGEAIVVRKEGFESVRLKVGAGGEIAVRMKKLGVVAQLRKCGAKEKMMGITGRIAQMRFPKVEGVEVTNRSRDIDYSMRFYRLKAKKEFGIRHGWGPMWSAGFPTSDRFINGMEYSEVQIGWEGLYLVDARGIDSEGKRWRFLGRYGESADYGGLDIESTRVLDRVLDGVCVGSGF
jgi:hypothetical protein